MSLWRKHMDSSHLAEPRTLVRVYVEPGELDAAIGFYEKLVHPPAERLGGAGCTVRHPDGTVIEYVHYRPSESEG